MTARRKKHLCLLCLANEKEKKLSADFTKIEPWLVPLAQYDCVTVSTFVVQTVCMVTNWKL